PETRVSGLFWASPAWLLPPCDAGRVRPPMGRPANRLIAVGDLDQGQHRARLDVNRVAAGYALALIDRGVCGSLHGVEVAEDLIGGHESWSLPLGITSASSTLCAVAIAAARSSGAAPRPAIVSRAAGVNPSSRAKLSWVWRSRRKSSVKRRQRRSPSFAP